MHAGKPRLGRAGRNQIHRKTINGERRLIVLVITAQEDLKDLTGLKLPSVDTGISDVFELAKYEDMEKYAPHTFTSVVI